MENESCLNRIIAKSESQNATVTERKIALYIKENLEKFCTATCWSWRS